MNWVRTFEEAERSGDWSGVENEQRKLARCSQIDPIKLGGHKVRSLNGRRPQRRIDDDGVDKAAVGDKHYFRTSLLASRFVDSTVLHYRERLESGVHLWSLRHVVGDHNDGKWWWETFRKIIQIERSVRKLRRPKSNIKRVLAVCAVVSVLGEDDPQLTYRPFYSPGTAVKDRRAIVNRGALVLALIKQDKKIEAFVPYADDERIALYRRVWGPDWQPSAIGLYSFSAGKKMAQNAGAR